MCRVHPTFPKKFRTFNSNKIGSRSDISVPHNRHNGAVGITDNEETLNQCDGSFHMGKDFFFFPSTLVFLKVLVNDPKVSGCTFCMNES